MKDISYLPNEDVMYKVLCSMVGNTPFYEHKELAELFNVKHLWIKDESSNLTGTIKDRKVLEMMRYDQTNRGYICITNGNMGFSLGTIVGEKDKVISVVDENIDELILRQLKQVSIVVKLPLQKKRITSAQLKEITIQHTSDIDRVWGWEMETSRISLYNYFMNELYRDIQHQKLNDADVKLVVPLGGGELMASCLVHELQSVNVQNQVVNRIYGYKTIGVTERNNFSRKIARRIEEDTVYWPLEDKKYVADKLVTAYIPTGANITITQAQKRGRADIVTVSGDEIMRAYKSLCKSNVKVEPSSAAAFAGLWKMNEKPEHVVVINTGRGVVEDNNDN